MVDLKTRLLLRVTLFALVVTVVSALAAFHVAKTRIDEHIVESGSALVDLVSSEATRPQGSFQFSLDRIEGLDLKSIARIAKILGACVEVKDIYNHTTVQRCFGDQGGAPNFVEWALSRIVGDATRYTGVIDGGPGVVIGELVATPNFEHEAIAVWDQLQIIGAATLSILVLNFIVYQPVRQALRPSDRIIETLTRLESGDLRARMPRPQLRELRHIAIGFDHLADRLQQTLNERQRIAQRLITVREEERRYLSRELHDEFGQLLTSITADSAYLSTKLTGTRDDLLPAVTSIRSVTTQMMESLQGILAQLRPQGLDEFGLEAGLSHLIDGWRDRTNNCHFVLTIAGDFDDLPDDLSVSLYRIVQEAVTNAVRHGSPQNIAVHLVRSETDISVIVIDDGSGKDSASQRSGFGLLGMEERVAALGGKLTFEARRPQGVRIKAIFNLVVSGLFEHE
ncbi:MAG: histidine kinase [Ectothiorhodospiraceae bacterium]|nr:histidine kinase [Ectothiorhodospiraceae bacterium]